ncbi:hypothetical protein PSTG_06816 [Puccinia striiformis f. sp. tritici PST-78]|uniref:Uncharacterized protein n=2 Tax=Puccinia striiformis f. sp. tritici TaxID=168172 RepID=A0A0L0VLW3_9BASI|nr:hypothetical protein PSTG_06816 [Puccinia striiformis f. sp. tritici PST-78]
MEREVHEVLGPIGLDESISRTVAAALLRVESEAEESTDDTMEESTAHWVLRASLTVSLWIRHWIARLDVIFSEFHQASKKNELAICSDPLYRSTKRASTRPAQVVHPTHNSIHQTPVLATYSPLHRHQISSKK